MPIAIAPMQFLRVIGRLYPDHQLVLRPGYLTENPPWSDREGDSPLRAEIFDERGAPLGSFPLRVSQVCLEGDAGQRPLAVRGFVPFHPRARRVVFSFHGHPIEEIRRSDAPPRVELTWQPEDQPGGRQNITWVGEHPENLPLQYILRFSNDGGHTWNRVGVRTEANEQELDLDEFPGGERCLLMLVATDGINTSTAVSAPFTLPRRPCAALLLRPLEGETFPAGQPIQLQGQGFWREYGRPEWEQLEWYLANDSSPIGRGPLAEIALEQGQYTIVLLAGEADNQGRAEVTIQVG